MPSSHHTLAVQALHTPVLRRTALACAVAVFTLAGGLLPGTALAERGGATALSDRVRFDIPAGSLDEALSRFGVQAAVLVSVDAASTAGKRSPGVRGEHAPAEALSLLLQGTQLVAVVQGDGSYLLAPAPEGSTLLPAVQVEGAVDRADATTEGSGAYASPAISTFKAGQSIRRTPQPVTVLSRQALDDRFLPDLHEVLLNVPGVTVDYVDSERVTYHSRGHQIDAIQFDGVTVSHGGSIFVQPDTAVLDRVEILRGSAGLLRGSGNPSATVNLVRKRPTAEFQASAGVTLGSWERRRFEGDISGPLIASGALRGRLVAVADEKEFFQRAREEDRKVLYGAIEGDLSSRTVLSVSYQYTDLDASGAWGNLPANFDGSQLNLPRSTYLGADWNQWNRYNQQAMVEVEHRFDSRWKIKLSAAEIRLKMDGDDGFKQTSFSRPGGATDPYLLNVSASIYGGDASEQRVFSVVADGPFRLFGREHQMLFGAESLRVETTGTSGYWNINAMTGVDIRTWDPYASMPEPFIGSDPAANYFAGNVNFTRQKGVYATTRLSVADPLTAILGARLSWWEYEVPSQPASDYDIDRETTPYLGLVYDIARDWSAYASYTEIFTPQNAYDVNGSILDPIRGEDYEAGIKGEHFDGRLNTTLAAFRINNVGRAMEDTATPNPCLPYYPNAHCRSADGKTRSEGWEVEATGEILRGWQITGGYTHTRTRYLRDPGAANIGRPLRTLDPKHLLRLFSTYRFDGRLNGLVVGGGVQAQSDIYATSGSVVYPQAGYTIYNAMAGYRFEQGLRLQLNLNNLTDKVYYRKVGSGVNNYYGDPRNVMLSLQYAF